MDLVWSAQWSQLPASVKSAWCSELATVECGKHHQHLHHSGQIFQCTLVQCELKQCAMCTVLWTIYNIFRLFRMQCALCFGVCSMWNAHWNTHRAQCTGWSMLFSTVYFPLCPHSARICSVPSKCSSGNVRSKRFCLKAVLRPFHLQTTSLLECLAAATGEDPPSWKPRRPSLLLYLHLHL